MQFKLYIAAHHSLAGSLDAHAEADGHIRAHADAHVR
jgi:hypothetical protein